MTLILTITNQPFTNTNQVTSCRFEDSGTIGRSNNCDWVLHDPSRYISGKHATISQRDGIFYILDASTNGLHINRSKTPLGKGNTSQLNNGDHLQIGQLEINVSIETQAQHLPEVKPQPMYEPSTPSSEEGLGLMDILEQKTDTQPSRNNTPLTPEAPLSNGESLGLLDILEQKTGAQPSSENTPLTPEVPFLAENSALIPQNPKPNSIIPAGSSTDHAHTLGEHFSPPPIIPDNWNFLPDSQSKQSKGPSSKSLPIDTSTPEEKSNISNINAQGDAPEIKPASPTIDNNKQHQHTQPLEDQALLQVLLDGMGLNEKELPAGEGKVFVNIIGKIVRETIEGMVTILRARTAVKSEFRMAMTTIKSQENNPLKFSVGTDEALRHMFFNQADNYLPPLQSLQEGFEDIQAHQIAMMAGMQAALKAILKQFDPTVLEQNFSHAEGQKKLLLGSRKAKHWDSYIEHYQKLMEHIEDDFQTQFGQEFTFIYEEQVAKLKAAKKNQ